MMVLEKSAFVHLPRTAGTFLRFCLEDNIRFFSDHGFQDNMVAEVQNSGRKLYGFVRNPIDWYQSWVALARNGSEVFPAANQEPALLALPAGASLDEAIHSLTNPSDDYKYNVLRMAIQARGGRLQNVMLVILKRWLDSPNTSYYQNMVNCYLSHCDDIGKTESIKPDLIRMLDSAGDLTQELRAKIERMPAMNAAPRTEFLSAAAVQEIVAADKAIFDRFGYDYMADR